MQILIVGRTGSGKTHAAKTAARAWLRASPGLVIVEDSKAERRYDDLLAPEFVAVRASVSDVIARPLMPGVRVAILRQRMGTPWQGVEAAEWYWSLVARGRPVCVLRDELVPSVANQMQWKRQHERVQQQYIQGRSWKMSLISLTTALRAVPLDCADNADEVWGFQTRGQALDVLDDREYLEGVPPGLLPSLKGKEAPPDERGEFVRLISGMPWNRVVYRF